MRKRSLRSWRGRWSGGSAIGVGGGLKRRKGVIISAVGVVRSGVIGVGRSGIRRVFARIEGVLFNSYLRCIWGSGKG